MILPEPSGIVNLGWMNPFSVYRWARGFSPSARIKQEFSGTLHGAKAPRPQLAIRLGPNLEDSQESFLRDIDLTHALHAPLAFLLLFEKFTLSRNVAAIALGDHILAYG